MEDWFTKCSAALEAANPPLQSPYNSCENLIELTEKRENEEENEKNEVKPLFNKHLQVHSNVAKKSHRFSKQVYNLNDFDDGEDENSLLQNQPRFVDNSEEKRNQINGRNNNNIIMNNKKINRINDENDQTNENENEEEDSDDESAEEILNHHLTLRRKYTVTPFDKPENKIEPTELRNNTFTVIDQQSDVWRLPKQKYVRPDSIRVLAETNRRKREF